MFDIDIILGMDWFHECFASRHCRTRVVKFQFPKEPILEQKGVNPMLRDQIISCLKSCKMIAKDCLLSVMDLECETRSIESVPVVRNSQTFKEFLQNGKLTFALI